MIGGAGLLMWRHPPVVSLPRLWWILAGVFMLAGASAFLPASWFAMPEWRSQLEKLGIETGSAVVIQARHAAEWLGLFAIMLFTGLWFAGHRPSPAQARTWALAFTVGVAFYAIFSKTMQEQLLAGTAGGEARYGLFTNRNHTATYLAMGSICGLGCMLQAIRDRRFAVMAVALAATGVCLWAVLGWSVSRGGLLLVLVGCSAWLAVLGRRYLGRGGGWAVGLAVFTVVSLFFILENDVKGRLAETIRKAEATIQPAAVSDPDVGKPEFVASGDLDFRIPTALDTLDLIRDFKWTGIGAGQFSSIFPQYRKLSASANNSNHLHPESDWLWMAAETGMPATLALATLVIAAFAKALSSILRGRDRALRSACLIAALLVPVHGLFDIPGHHLTLAWSSVFLFTLSLRFPSPQVSGQPPPAGPRKWPFRLAALAMLAVATFLIRSQWWHGPQPAITTANAALTEARGHYKKALSSALRNQAGSRDSVTRRPDISARDRLAKGLRALEQASLVVPLNREILSYRAFLTLHFYGQYEKVDQLFAITRALDPSWVDGPLRQARIWAPIDPRRSAELLRETLTRAAVLDQIKPGTPWSSQATRLKIQHLARTNPDLEKLLPAVSPAFHQIDN
jgi:hypothetical protein